MIPAGKKWRQARPKRGRQKASAHAGAPSGRPLPSGNLPAPDPDVSKAPPNYARVIDGKPVFETGSITWGPKVIDQILKAYK